VQPPWVAGRRRSRSSGTPPRRWPTFRKRFVGQHLLCATAHLRAGWRHEAGEILRKRASLPEKNTVGGLAGYHAVAGDKSEAMRLLRRALDLGVLDPVLAPLYRSDPDLTSLRGDPEFEKIVSAVRQGNRRAGS